MPNRRKLLTDISSQLDHPVIRPADLVPVPDVGQNVEQRPAKRHLHHEIVAEEQEPHSVEVDDRAAGAQEWIRPVARGGYYNKGEGLRMALAAGAAPAGEYGSYHAEPVDPRSHQAEAVVFIWPYGILVNKRGRRFVDEASGTVDAIYDNVTRSIADQPDGIAWVIFDAQVEDIPRWRTSIRSDQPAYEASTLGKLAEMLGLPAAELEATVDAFNAACPRSEGEFTPFAVDGRKTNGLEPVKSNWSRPLVKAPFRAYPIISANCFTFGGLKVNTDAQVLDKDGRVIPGLYAAGETVGIYHQVYTGSTSVLRGAVFGRLAGRHAVATLR